MTEQAVSTEEVLAEVAAATADVPKKVRQAKHDPDGQVLEMPKKERKPKEPKAPKLYAQLAEDGTPLLNEDGTPVMGETKPPKPTKPKKEPKLDADGNPITRARVLPTNGDAKITWTDKAAGYKGARAEMCAMRVDGQTIDEYLALGGDKGFLRFYVRDGAATVE